MKGPRGVCTVEGCGRPHKARGYCAVHYQHWMRGMPINPIVRTRDRNGPETCTADGCAEGVKAKGLCATHYARLLRHGHVKKTRRTQPTKVCTVEGCDSHFYALGLCHQHWLRSRKMKEQYGLSLGDLDRMLVAQGGGCGICGEKTLRANWRSGKQDAFHLDHDHRTGIPRGLLCDNCNRGLGFFADDPVRLRAAIAYLDRHAGPDPDFPLPMPEMTGAYIWPPGLVN